MLAIIEAVAMPPDGHPGRPVKHYAYTQEECNDAPVKGDSVQDANLALRIYGTHRNVTHYRATYRKFSGCPLNVIEDMMAIYAAIKRALRDCRKGYLADKAAKAAKREVAK